ncbi:antitoxin Xre-like helix-turn-helix domain-containing protein [Janthinobacterium sp.]|uniref:antitoxin Xre-like helix-turn-helix domain-containing protein n=1 Tax=Janthinobacterium sp. TaxID=1871054 RepID=UPI00293D6268|nr:antitoxin Xre-like helix-turn-helix domain-containing protein [Janthinobacterium sp.]
MADPKASAAKPAGPFPAPQSQGRQTTRTTSSETRGEVVPARDFVDIAITQLYHSDPQRRIAVVRRGIPAASVGQLFTRMGVSNEYLIKSLHLSLTSIKRKEREGRLLSSEESERLLCVETLIGMAQTMVEQSGDPSGFDAPRWVSSCLAQPLPALAGATPASYRDTFEGQKLVAEILSMSQSGAYA